MMPSFAALPIAVIVWNSWPHMCTIHRWLSSELTTLPAESDVVSYTHLWLDMRVTLGHSLDIQLHSKNTAALMGTGCLEHSTLPVFESWDGPTKERAKWWLNARVHRISHINGSIESIVV